MAMIKVVFREVHFSGCIWFVPSIIVNRPGILIMATTSVILILGFNQNIMLLACFA